jgi:hypothetical protein
MHNVKKGTNPMSLALVEGPSCVLRRPRHAPLHRLAAVRAWDRGEDMCCCGATAERAAAARADAPHLSGRRRMASEGWWRGTMVERHDNAVDLGRGRATARRDLTSTVPQRQSNVPDFSQNRLQCDTWQLKLA